MFATTARRSTAFLLFAALQFVVLTGVAMQLYPEYRFGDHFLSQLGVTRTWDGIPNHASALVFAIAVVTLGAAMVAFAAAWRDYAFARGRARPLGVASQICGMLSGLGFVGVGFAPMDHVLDLHNTLVVVAFALLLVFSICLTLVWVRNGAPRGVIAAGVLYAVGLAVFFGVAIWVVRTDMFAHVRKLIVGQKIVVYASMAYVAFLTLTIRRELLARS